MVIAVISMARNTLPDQTPLLMRLLYTLALVALSIAANAQVPSYVPTTGLLGWWPFNGNANDESGNGNNGTVNGAVLSPDRFGTPNSAFTLNGLDQNVDGNIAGISSMVSSTITAWVNYTGNAGGQPYDFFFQFGVYGNHTFAYGYNFGGQNIDLYSFCTGGIPAYTAINLNNAWHFIAIVDSVDVSRLYVDGVLLASGVGGPLTDCYQGSPYFQIGGGSDNQWVTGGVDDIGFWNRGLTEQEVMNLFNGQVQPPCVSTEALTMDGLDTSYETTDGPATLTGNPPNGVFLGPGVSGASFDPGAAGVGTHTIIYTYVDENGCVNSTGLCTSVSLGIGIGDVDNMPLQGVRVFPNPADGLFNLELELQGMVSLVVFDSRGRQVMNQTFMANSSKTLRVLDLSRAAAGTYSLQVSTSEGSVQQFLVRE
ncbi:MAG: T9SS type A sorting domain-containing protein [Flavobacteriales bacterium]|nr:T9SS type A sorting domain-containing protein [Flavobacteriales bacterium]MBP6644043.1 T9SS type A sorting domain-containing protein [Flavobacteriales bacterium]